jgi:predicted Zn-dependent peptidase
MRSVLLQNGVKLIYNHREGDITSMCIGFGAGAICEYPDFTYGTSHALEHMISKGTRHRSEEEINRIMDGLFGFENAMTNYPYTIYYGSCMREDVKGALSIYSDILLNPLFREKDFKSEKNIILEEFKEWKGDPYRRCQDVLFSNSFKNRRIKELIIGSRDNIKSITLTEIEDFYRQFYIPENCVVSFSTSMDFDNIVELFEHYFGSWKNLKRNIEDKKCREVCEKNMPGVYRETKKNADAVKIQYIFDMGNLRLPELKALEILNCVLGEGTSSLLFDRVRTKNAAAYEIGSRIQNERGMQLLSISMGTSIQNAESSINSIDSVIRNMKMDRKYLNEHVSIKTFAKRIEMKRKLLLERSIQLCKELTTYELMYGNFERVYDEVSELEKIDSEAIYSVMDKVLVNPSVQVLEI